MRKHTKRRVVFAGKSLVWASLLFIVVMGLLNWNDMKSGVSGQYVIITSATDTVMQRISPPSIEPIRAVIDKSHTFLKAVRSSTAIFSN